MRVNAVWNFVWEESLVVDLYGRRERGEGTASVGGERGLGSLFTMGGGAVGDCVSRPAKGGSKWEQVGARAGKAEKRAAKLGRAGGGKVGNSY